MNKGTQARPITSELYFIDAHSQVDQHVEDLNVTIKLIDEAGVYRTLLAARGFKLPPAKIVAFVKEHPDRIIPMIKTKCRAYIMNDKEYYKTLQE